MMVDGHTAVMAIDISMIEKTIQNRHGEKNKLQGYLQLVRIFMLLANELPQFFVKPVLFLIEQMYVFIMKSGAWYTCY
jgi:hypothetical protein